MSQNEYEERKPIIYLAGIGMGQDDQLTGEVLDCLDRADAVMGARRMLDAAAPYTEGKAVLAAYKPSEMVNWLSSFEWDEAVLVLSGDTGFYSGAEAASKAFLQEGWEVEYNSRCIQSFLFLRQTRQKLAECSQYQQPWPQLRRSFPYPSL